MKQGSGPLVTVITAVKDGVDRLPATLDSVATLSHPDCEVEHVVVDGGSIDGTVELLTARSSPNLRVVLESDDGIYAALNKGIELARGEWLLFLGDDDVIANRSLFREIFSKCDSENGDLICGASRYRNSVPRRMRLNWRTYVFNPLHHQAVLYHCSLFKKFRYRTDIPVVADYELNFLAYRRGFNVCYVDSEISICGDEGVSWTSNQLSNCLDLFRIRSRYLNPLLNTMLLLIGTVDLLAARLRQFFWRRAGDRLRLVE